MVGLWSTGMMVSGFGGFHPSALCGRIVFEGELRAKVGDDLKAAYCGWC